MTDTDILDRLRTSRHKVPEHMVQPERREAAAEIERLRAALSWIVDHSSDPGIIKRAKKELGRT